MWSAFDHRYEIWAISILIIIIIIIIIIAVCFIFILFIHCLFPNILSVAHGSMYGEETFRNHRAYSWGHLVNNDKLTQKVQEVYGFVKSVISLLKTLTVFP